MLLSRIGIDLIIWQAVFTVLITAVVICRFWAARIKRRALRIDDYLVVLSYVCLKATSLTMAETDGTFRLVP